MDEEFDKILTQIDSSVNAELVTELPTTAVVTTTCTSTRVYSSPKGTKAVKAAMFNSVPQKTRVQTNWTVKVWTEWALTRNARLLPDERPFSTRFRDLSISEINFWLSRFVLVIRKKNGEQYPPNSLYQLICGLQRNLRENGRADVKLFDDPALHGFRSTLDGEMKHLNATGNYVNKRQAEPITPEQENHLWEMGLLGDHNAKVLLNTMVFEVGFFFALRSGNEHPTIETFSFSNSSVRATR